MAIQFGYRVDGLETRYDGATIPYRLIGESSESIARAYAEANIPLLFGAFYRKDVRLVRTALTVWDVDAEFSTVENREASAYDHSWSFDTSGKSRHTTQAIQHISTYKPSSRTAIDHNGAIGVTEDSVDGVDVPDRAYKWTEVWQLPATSFGFTYSTVLGELTGRMNASYFRGFPAYTVQFQGANGGRLSSEGDLREFSFSFEVSPTENGITIGDITGINKIGWDYLWVRYECSDDTASKKTTPKPIQVEVDRVLYAFNFSLLGIGSGVLS